MYKFYSYGNNLTKEKFKEDTVYGQDIEKSKNK